MYRFVPKARYAQFLTELADKGLLDGCTLAYSDFAQFSGLQKTAERVGEHGVEQAVIYCPSYQKKGRYVTLMQYLKLGDAIIVELLRGGVEVLRVAAAQAYIKQIPLVLLDMQMAHAVERVSSFYTYTVNTAICGPRGYCAVFSAEQVAELLEIRLERSACGPIYDKQGNRHELLQVDLPIEYNALAGLMAKAFLDDPTWIAVQPHALSRQQMIYQGCYGIAKGTAARGMNYLVVRDANIFNAQAALLASPPGYKRGFWGSDVDLAAAMIKGHVSVFDLPSLTFLEQFHKRNCGKLDNHVYVGWVSCVAGSRSQGIGSALFGVINDIADYCKASVYLENSKERNLEFYRKMGLQVVQRFVVARDGREKAIGYGMRRPAEPLSSDALNAVDYNAQDAVVRMRFGYGG